MFFVYIMANRRNGTIYLGQTADLIGRVWEHKSGLVKGFTDEWSCHRLVWFELHDTRMSAFTRERRMKKWYRGWKIEQIVKLNPRWDDLSLNMTDVLLFDERRLFVPPSLVDNSGDGFPRARE